jgi:uncharacterized protein YcfJ
MKAIVTISLIACAIGYGAIASAQVTLYEREDYRGRTFQTDDPVRDMRDRGFNDRASSAIVDRSDWEVCEDPGFRGRCVVLRQGSYDSLRGMGLNDRISSVRRVDGRRSHRNRAPEPTAGAIYEYRQRPNERTFDARVTSVHAVMGPPEQRCWVERQEVRDRPNAGGAVIGALLGGVIGHQIGAGRGRDVATIGGAAVGGVIGANAGRDDRGDVRDVQRCENVSDAAPAYWDVTYRFRDDEHRMQMSSPPGDTVRVNEDGEPRQ